MSATLPGWAVPLTSRPPTWWLLVRLTGFVATLATVLRVAATTQNEAAGIVLVVASAISVAGCLGWTFSGRRSTLMCGSLIVSVAMFGIMIGLASTSAASVMGGTAAYSAAFDLRFRDSVLAVVTGCASLALAVLAFGASPTRLLFVLIFILMWWAGLSHRQYLDRAEQAELLLEESRRAREASDTAAALAERARIAREIHDILAHSLSALWIHLEVVAGALDNHSKETSAPLLTKATEGVRRAQRLARDGLAEIQDAVTALREDPTPLPTLLRSLVTDHDGDAGTTVSLTVNGVPRQASPEARLAVYRATQEALTNARKHAPGSAVEVELTYLEQEIVVTISSAMPTRDVMAPLADGGAGYGLIGLRERAELAGGSLTAEPVDNRWTVSMSVPS